MNLLGKEPSYRRLSRLPQARPYKDNPKRIFGRDITNLEHKTKKNVSIYEKNYVCSKNEPKPRSYSLCGRKQVAHNSQSQKDPIHQYKQDVIDFMIDLQKPEAKEKPGKIDSKMKQVLIDWLIDVHESFELKEQTLHLALSYLSDYSSLRYVTKEEYQLLGITCLWIASKYEQIYPPRTKNYVEVTADTYSLRDLKEMESNILKVLNFDLNRTTGLQLLEAFKESIPEKNISLCKYAIELALFEGIAKKYEPSTLVLAAIKLADKIFKTKSELKLNTTKSIQRDDIKYCFKEITQLLQEKNRYELKALKRKFGKHKYHGVGKKIVTVNQ